MVLCDAEDCLNFANDKGWGGVPRERPRGPGYHSHLLRPQIGKVGKLALLWAM